MSNKWVNYSIFPKPLQMSTVINALKYSMTATTQICVYPQFTVTFLTKTLLIIYESFLFHKNLDSTFFQSVPKCLSDYTVSHPRGQWSSWSPPSEHQTSQTVKTNQTTGGNLKFILPFASSNYGPNLKVVTSLRPATWGRMTEWKQSSVGFRSRYEVSITLQYPLDR